MSGWDIISDVVTRTFSGMAMGPAGFVLNPAGFGPKILDELFGDDSAQRTYAGGGGTFGGPSTELPPAPPYPGTTPEGEPPPGQQWPGPAGSVPPPPAPPAPPGTSPDGSSGAAAEAASADAAEVARLMEQLDELDKKAASTVDAVHASGELVEKTMQDIARDVDGKIAELGPRLNTADGQQELRDFLKERLETAKQVLEQQIADAEAKARETSDLASQYNDLAGNKDGGSGATRGDTPGSAGGSDSGGSSPVGTTPAGAEAAANQTPTGTSPLGTGMMPAGGMPMSMPSLPSFGGGGMPGMGGGGFGDPLSSLSGLGATPPGGDVPQLQDDLGAEEDTAGEEPLTLQDGETGSSPDDHSDTSAEQTGSSEDQEQGTQPASNEGAAGADGAAAGTADSAVPSESGTQIDYVDDQGNEVTTEARNEQAAAAVRAHMNGASVSESYADQNITLPPPGTPITDPKMMVPPGTLRAGDVGVFKDHLVMALGNGKVFVSGQVQPLESIGSGPDFLGWIDPTAGQGGTDPAAGGPQAAPTNSSTPNNTT